MRWIVDLCYLLAALFVAPVVIYRAITTGKYRQDWDQRTGRLPQLPPLSPLWPRVWVHAVSVGEVNAARGLITAWRDRSPETEFILSTTTDTGQARAKQLFPDLRVIRYPLDLSPFVERALNAVSPNLVVLVELEVWYQFVTRAAARNIPVAIVNGRLSEKSVRRFGRIQRFTHRMFKPLTWVGAQDDVYAERFRTMGVPADRVHVTGSLKWDTAQIVDKIPDSEFLARAMGIDPNRPLWVCGSTGPGEEKVVLQAFAKLRDRHHGLQLAIVPRKPERFDEVAELIQQAGFQCVRRSACPDTTTRLPVATEIHLIDTMGELRKLYSLANVVFVGRTMAKMGGSDMMEVAALARPIVVGPHTENFVQMMEALKQGQGILEMSANLDAPDVVEQLIATVHRLLDKPAEAQYLADNARQVVKQNLGATQRTLNALLEILQRA